MCSMLPPLPYDALSLEPPCIDAVKTFLYNGLELLIYLLPYAYAVFQGALHLCRAGAEEGIQDGIAGFRRIAYHRANYVQRLYRGMQIELLVAHIGRCRPVCAVVLVASVQGHSALPDEQTVLGIVEILVRARGDGIGLVPGHKDSRESVPIAESVEIARYGAPIAPYVNVDALHDTYALVHYGIIEAVCEGADHIEHLYVTAIPPPIGDGMSYGGSYITRSTEWESIEASRSMQSPKYMPSVTTTCPVF